MNIFNFKDEELIECIMQLAGYCDEEKARRAIKILINLIKFKHKYCN